VPFHGASGRWSNWDDLNGSLKKWTACHCFIIFRSKCNGIKGNRWENLFGWRVKFESNGNTAWPKTNKTSSPILSILNLSESHLCELIKCSPRFWLTHCNHSIHARKIFCNSSKVISSQNYAIASKISFELCSCLSVINCFNVPKHLKSHGLRSSE
jgi:hypothetical protein